jgi:hypothetical protein
LHRFYQPEYYGKPDKVFFIVAKVFVPDKAKLFIYHNGSDDQHNRNRKLHYHQTLRTQAVPVEAVSALLFKTFTGLKAERMNEG